MRALIHGIPEEIMVGDLVETTRGVGVVRALSEPTGERDRAKIEVDLGRKWMSLEEVTVIIQRVEGERRRSPEARWDERD